MDKEEPVKTLTTVMVNHFGSQVVQDKLYKDKLVGEANYVLQFSEPFLIGFDRFYMKEADSEGKHYRYGFVNSECTEKECHKVYNTIKEAIEKEKNCKEGANYFFIDGPVQEKDRVMNFFVTPYSILGKKEAQNLRNLFYKNVPLDIMSAMYTLGIEDYTDIYKFYYTGGLDNKFLDNISIRLKLENLLSNMFWGLNDYVSKERFEEFIGSSINDMNAKIYPNITHIPLFSDGKMYKSYIVNIVKEFEKYTLMAKYKNLPLHFLDFIFTTPYEDQNIETNKEILKRYSQHINYTEILAKEYTSGEHFQEYFNCLDFEKQEKLVDSLKILSERKPINDSFLWSAGFKNIKLDHLELYKNDTKGFIDYFNHRDAEEKKMIIKDIMGCDATNEEVVNWLNKNCLELVREVGFNG